MWIGGITSDSRMLYSYCCRLSGVGWLLVVGRRRSFLPVISHHPLKFGVWTVERLRDRQGKDSSQVYHHGETGRVAEWP